MVQHRVGNGCHSYLKQAEQTNESGFVLPNSPNQISTLPLERMRLSIEDLALLVNQGPFVLHADSIHLSTPFKCPPPPSPIAA